MQTVLEGANSQTQTRLILFGIIFAKSVTALGISAGIQLTVVMQKNFLSDMTKFCCHH